MRRRPAERIMPGMMHNALLRRLLAPVSLLGILAIVSALPAARAGGNTGAAAAAPGVGSRQAAVAMARLDAAGGLSNELFGSALALDGELLAVGAGWTDAGNVRDAGTVYLYTRDPSAPSGWSEIKKLTADKLEVGAEFGHSVALHGDVLAVGAPNENNFGSSENGVAYVFERNQGGANAWGLAKKLNGTAGQFGRFGSDVALGGDVLVVGAQNATTLNAKGGAAYLFSRAAGWSEIQRVSNVDGAIGDLFGTAVAIDGDTLVVGAEQADYTFVDGNQGTAFVYQRNAGGIWELFARLVADVPSTGSKFGRAVAIDGDSIVVGAPQSPTGGSSPIDGVGAAFVFERNTGGANAWGRSRRLDPSGGARGDTFGTAVALAGDQILAGASFAGTSGYVYRFERNLGGANIWGQAERMEQPGLLWGESFGEDVALSGATTAVGAPGRDAGHGAVYFPGQAVPPTASGTQIYLPLTADEALVPTGTLQPGGIVKAASGAVIGAVDGAIPAPVAVTIAATTAPAETLGTIVKPTGEYYLAGAAEPVLTPIDKPLLIGLPVPAGADPKHLAMAVLTPAGLVGEAPGGAGSLWGTQQGSYDADSNLFVATIGALLPDGATVVLVEHPQLEPLPQSVAAGRVAPAQTTAKFVVTCEILWSLAACTAANRTLLASELELAYADFVGTHKFREPRLWRTTGAFDGTALEPVLTPVDYYFGIAIDTSPCALDFGFGIPIGGAYNSGASTLIVCMTPTSTSDSIRPVVRHEFFHAIQYAYDQLYRDSINDPGGQLTDWTIEGTATAAARSSSAMLPWNEFSVHKVSDSLTDNTERTGYSAQDMWVYTGLRLAIPISYLRPIFERGGTPEHVAAARPLADDYWQWAKNQAFEKVHNLDGTLKTGRCTPETAVFGTPFTLRYDKTDNVQGTLPPLTSEIVEVTIDTQVEVGFIHADNDADSDDLRYKVYRDPSTADCDTSESDGPRAISVIRPAQKYFVLLSNISLTDSYSFVVQVRPGFLE